jgi:cell surface protein SprA
VANPTFLQQQDTVKKDTLAPYKPSKAPTFQPAYRFGDPFSNRISRSPLFLRDPSQLDMQVQFNPDSTADDKGVTYSVYENIGNLDFRPASFMSFEEYNRYNNSQLNREYFKERSAGLDGESAVSGRSLIPRLYLSPGLDRIFGGSYVDIQPNGFVTLDFGGRFQRTENPSLSLRQQRNGSFNFDQQISMSVVGKVGEKLAVTANFDNNNTFDFQNDLKVEYTGYEEDIIKRIEIGNVSMPVSNSLMSGAQSLFGIKTELQFGRLYATGILTQQRSTVQTVSLNSQNDQLGTGLNTNNSGTGGGGNGINLQSSDYDENRHFFLGHYFRDNFEKSLRGVPQIQSGINIQHVEVYVLNRNSETRTTRNIVALMDLGEGTRIHRKGGNNIGPGKGGVNRNQANDMFASLETSTPKKSNQVDGFLNSKFGPNLENGVDYVSTINARLLETTEYSINKELGYLSLTRSLGSDELLAISYVVQDYTSGKTYKVGEITTDYQGRSDDEVIFLKLLRPNRVNVAVPTWDLMMKNIYRINGNNISPDGFQLRILYRDDNGQDNPYLNEGDSLKDQLLIQVMGLDRLNQTLDRQPNANFDFIDGATIDAENGYIIFPILEPFGSWLNSRFGADEGRLKEKYVYSDLYSEIQITAKQNLAKDKFALVGSFSAGSSSGSGGCSERLPGFNIPRGSVVVTGAGTVLREGSDYTINYTSSTIEFSDQWCERKNDISISFESQDLFSFQTKTLTGARLDYRFNENFNIGATILHHNERTGGISRYAVGQEPTSNTKYGFDVNYQQDSRLITKLVDALPLVSTKAPSSVTFNAEFAQLIPGTSNIVDGEGTSYIDDFESAATPINIGGWQSWKLAATPKAISSSTGLEFNDRKAKIAWYTVDNSIFYRPNNRPASITDEDLTNHYERAVFPQEIFRQRDNTQVNINESIFDIAYFPGERGQYNYNKAFEDGLTKEQQEQNWGGITRAITGQTNFVDNNIQYLEFWLLDPFIDGDNGVVKDGFVNKKVSTNDQAGMLIIHLGEVSEDITNDNLFAFENGLPITGAPVLPSELSTWGRITDQQFLTDFFENSPGARANQDVGLDGLDDDEEHEILERPENNRGGDLSDDISADNFLHPLDASYGADAKIVQRYKNWNGMERNSPTSTSGGSFIPSSTSRPDSENIDLNPGAQTNENYHEYRIPLEYNENTEGGNLKMNPFIVDQITSQDGEATWYLHRIPLSKFSKTVGTPNLVNVRHVRLYLTEWSAPVVLRMARMQYVGNQWRKLTQALNEEGFDEVPESEVADFTVSVVGIEENSTPTSGGSPYVVPPGFNRDRDNTTALNRRINEQSLQICVEDLEDKDARAVSKLDNKNLVNYGRIKMFLHAESYKGGAVKDDQVKAFLRLMTDSDGQYYEIEVDLKITESDLTGATGNIQRLVWPEDNEIDVSLKELIGLKSERDRNKINEATRYTQLSNDGKYHFTVKGNPDLSRVVAFMIGVRNPGDASISPKSFCVWANELRLTDFDKTAGWAANARLNTQLADLGNISVSTNYRSIGFGSIQDKISQRSQHETKQLGVVTNFNLEKFMFPEKTGLKVPMFMSYDKTMRTPKYDPFSPDVPLEAALENIDSDEERERYRSISQDITTSRSINFVNVGKDKVNPDSKNRVYDIENFGFSYSYSDVVSTGPTIQQYLSKTVSGGVNYNYSPIALTIEPFKESEKLSSPYFALIKDFNVSLFPSNFSFSTDLSRDFKSRTYYDSDLKPVDPLYEKLFTFRRNYNLRWDLSKGLGLTYSSAVNAVIDEPTGNGGIEGDIDTSYERGLIWDQILTLGRMKNFNQNIAANYKIPLGKLPFTDWISSDIRYSVGYSWVAGSISRDNDNLDQDLYFGNFISNQRDRVLNARIDMTKLYNKVTFLKNANEPAKADEQASVGNGILRFFMMLKSVNGSYKINESTSLPGFAPSAFLFGLDSGFNAPGFGFILGSQDPLIKSRAEANNWLVKNETLNSPFTQSYGTDINIQGELEPVKDVRIQLTLNRGVSNQYQEIFRFNGIDDFEPVTPSRSGSYSTSFLSIRSAFERSGENNASATFTQFENNLAIVRERLNRINPASDGNSNQIEYDTISQDVLIPAFIAAYSGKSADNVSLSPFPRIPLPNWRVDYAGLTKIPAISELFSSFTISHGYNSTYSVSNYTNSFNVNESQIGLQNDILDYPLAQEDSTSRFVPLYIINQVLISEQFVPLIGINLRTVSNISTRIEYRKSRILSLNMANSQVTETSNNDVTLDFGYTKTGLKLPWRFQGRTITLENDVTFRIAGSVRDSKSIQRKLFDEDVMTPGSLQYQFRPQMSYKLNKQLDLTMYFERNVTMPKTSNQYITKRTNFGIQLRFGLAQ